MTGSSEWQWPRPTGQTVSAGAKPCPACRPGENSYHERRHSLASSRSYRRKTRRTSGASASSTVLLSREDSLVNTTPSRRNSPSLRSTVAIDVSCPTDRILRLTRKPCSWKKPISLTISISSNVRRKGRWVRLNALSCLSLANNLCRRERDFFRLRERVINCIRVRLPDFSVLFAPVLLVP
jgi:hypothetical protein